MITDCPPAAKPPLGETLAMVGGGANVKPLAKVPSPPGVLTTILTAPPACAGVVQVNCVVLLITTFVAAEPPNVTAEIAAKFVPVSVTAVPPLSTPMAGAAPVTVGALK